MLGTYIGQAAYLRKHPGNVANSFFALVPGPIYWPTFVVEVCAAVIVRQALISGAFVVISQSQSLGCFPRVKVVHTSSKQGGQVYIPEVNYFLMISSVMVTLAFRTTEKIGSAYGNHPRWTTLFFAVFISLEGMYLSYVLSKITQGGFLPLAFSVVLTLIMGTWHYSTKQRFLFEVRKMVPTDYIGEVAADPRVHRIPSIGLFYSEPVVQGLPPIFPRIVKTLRSVHSVLVLLSTKIVPESAVAVDNRFVFTQIEAREFRVFRCVINYGYTDTVEEPREFEFLLIEKLKIFISQQDYPISNEGQETRGSSSSLSSPSPSSCSGSGEIKEEDDDTNEQLLRLRQEEIEFVANAKGEGVVYLLVEAEVVAKDDSCLLKKLVVNYGYNFLRKNTRQGDRVLKIPSNRHLRVGMTYEI